MRSTLKLEIPNAIVSALSLCVTLEETVDCRVQNVESTMQTLHCRFCGVERRSISPVRFCPIFSGLFMNSIQVIRRMAAAWNGLESVGMLMTPFSRDKAYKLVNKFRWHNGSHLLLLCKFRFAQSEMELRRFSGRNGTKKERKWNREKRNEIMQSNRN